ncbi:hypothetical protein F511_10863 [Dorcoceras hygrometricum]|uniref:Uncharacterized protein n=1 Tax=Dorcoceras hygrometricum TaxID=472368 RepID=A0A2Z7BTD9_9LAMI|nr:hypothetical protein F511_10863 [Dorcoceras hygrometricum]
MANSVLLVHSLSAPLPPSANTKILQLRHPFSLSQLKRNPFRTSLPKSLTFYTKKLFVRGLEHEGTDASSPSPALVGGEFAKFLLSRQKISSWLYFSGIFGVVFYVLNFAWIDNPTSFDKAFTGAISSISDSPEALSTMIIFTTKTILKSYVNKELKVGMLARTVIFAIVHSGLASLRDTGEKLIGEHADRVLFAGLSRPLAVSTAWLCRYGGTQQQICNLRDGKSEIQMGGFSDEISPQIPTQAQSLVEGSGAVLVSEYKPVPDVDYLQELLAIQQQGPRAIGFFGTRNMGFMHQELIEILSYALVITKNHIYTSGASGTNAAVIRGALRAEKPELLTVILPQSLKKQPTESQELLSKVQNVIEKPHNDHLPLIEASRLCNMDIISQVQQIICFAFHDSRLLMETCQEAKNMRKIVTLFYLD